MLCSDPPSKQYTHQSHAGLLALGHHLAHPSRFPNGQLTPEDKTHHSQRRDRAGF